MVISRFVNSRFYYSARMYPFLCLALYERATELVLMSARDFHRLASELRVTSRASEKAARVCVSGMTARCGSTLLAQAANRTAGTRVVSEPWCFVSAYMRWEGGGVHWGEYERLLGSLMSVQTTEINNIE